MCWTDDSVYGKVEKMRWVEDKKAWLAYVNPRNGKKDEVIWQASQEKQEPEPNGHGSFMKGMETSDPKIRSYWLCGFCWKETNQPHEKNKDGNWTVKHDCQGKCKGYRGLAGIKEKCEKSNQVKFTQENINLLWDKTYGEAMCPDCRIK